MRKTVLALILLFALLLGACGAPDKEDYSLTLWLVESDPLAEAMRRLADEYNSRRERKALAVTTRVWQDEESLLRALQSGARPALILCTHARAFSLQDEKLLRDCESLSLSYPAWLRERADCIGRSFFPVGSQISLLCARGELPAGTGALLDLAASCRAPEQPCLSVDRFAPLFYQVLLDAGKEFCATPQRDLLSEDYVNLYNTLADAAFEGGLTLEPDAETPWRIERSTALPAQDLHGCRLAPLSEGPLLAETYGLAVTARDTRMLRALPAFLRWLTAPGRLGEIALEAGLIPAAEEPLVPNGALEETLLSLMGRSLHLPDADCRYYVNRSVFEESFRAALELLH